MSLFRLFVSCSFFPDFASLIGPYFEVPFWGLCLVSNFAGLSWALIIEFLLFLSGFLEGL
jgi:hypothetical protein